MQFCVEFQKPFEDEWIFDEVTEEPVIAGGRKAAELVAAAFRRLGCETTEPYVEDVHGWFWKTTYQERLIDCQAVDMDETASIYLTFWRNRQRETFYALLTLLDQELKRDSSLSNFSWSVLEGGRYREIGPVLITPPTRPDPSTVLASPETYDLPASAEEKVIAGAVGGLIRLFRLFWGKA